MLKKHIAIIMCVVLAAATLCGCGKNESASVETATTGTNVSVYSVEEGDLESTVAYSGTISASESVSISSKVGAKANNVFVDEGDYVKKGEVLCELDATDIRLAYEQALAGYNSAVAGYNSVVNSTSKQSSAQARQALASAQIAYDQAKANYEREKALHEANVATISAQTGVTTAENSIANAENALAAAQNNYDRIKQLFDMGGATQIELDNAETNLESAKLALENAKASSRTANASLATSEITSSAALDNARSALANAENALKTANENIGLTAGANEAAIKNARASVESARAAMNIAKNNLNNTTITSPIDGFVSKCVAVRGQMVTPGVELFAVKNTESVEAQINVTESVIPLIHEGSKAVVSVASADLYDIEGSVTGVNPVKDEITGLYSVKVTMENSDGALNVGMLADIRLTTASLDEIIKIPSEALINENDEYYVYVAKGDIAEKVEVSTGISDESFTEIIRGVEAGDKVVVNGKEYLSETNNEINITEQYEN